LRGYNKQHKCLKKQDNERRWEKKTKMTGDKIALFKTKEEVLKSMERGDVIILPEVLRNLDFTSAGVKDVLGFMAESGSDYTIIEVKSVKNNPEAFFKLAFGGEVHGSTHS
jgi:hypothetical protein